MAAKALKFLTVPALSKHTATVIFIHGLGDTGAGWKPVADMFQSDKALSHVKWVLPHAPAQPVTANMGMVMPSWFDILSFGFDAGEDSAGMATSAASISALIDAEITAGVPAERIVLGGFSQGGAMSLRVGLTRKDGDESKGRLAGVAVLSGWLPLRSQFKAMASPHAAEIPLFWGHGTIDPLVRFDFGRASVDFLKKELGFPEGTLEGEGARGLVFKSYDGVGHSTNQKELDDLRRWLKKVLPE